MRRDQDDDINDDEDEILKDGQSVRVPITFMDAERKEMLRQKYRGHRPGFRYADTDDADANDDVAGCSRDEYLPVASGCTPAPVVADEPYRPTSLETLGLKPSSLRGTQRMAP